MFSLELFKPSVDPNSPTYFDQKSQGNEDDTEV